MKRVESLLLERVAHTVPLLSSEACSGLGGLSRALLCLDLFCLTPFPGMFLSYYHREIVP